MAEEHTLTIRTPGAAPILVEAPGAVVARRDRLRWAALAFGGGILLGALSILLPGLHLVATWLLPLAGTGVAAWLLDQRLRIDALQLPCPRCGHALRRDRGLLVPRSGARLRCPHCRAPLRATGAS